MVNFCWRRGIVSIIQSWKKGIVEHWRRLVKQYKTIVTNVTSELNMHLIIAFPTRTIPPELHRFSTHGRATLSNLLLPKIPISWERTDATMIKSGQLMVGKILHSKMNHRLHYSQRFAGFTFGEPQKRTIPFGLHASHSQTWEWFSYDMEDFIMVFSCSYH